MEPAADSGPVDPEAVDGGRTYAGQAGPAEGTEAAVGERRHPLRRLGSAVFWLVVAGLVALAVALVAVPAATGAVTVVVKSGSMAPALPVGTAAVVRPQPVESITRGDVITFADDDAGGRLVTHRVVEVQQATNGLRFVTKGDANEDPDPGFVPAEKVRGVLWYQVPWVGTARDLVTSTAGLLYAAGLVLLLLAAHMLLPRTRRR